MENTMTTAPEHMDKRLAGKVQAESVSVNGMCGVAKAGDAHVKGASGVVMSEGKAEFTGGAGVMMSGGDLDLHRGGAPLIMARGESTIERGGGAVIVTREARIGEHGYAGVVVASKVKVADGGKVLITALPALLMGAMVGVTFALARSLLMGSGSRERSTTRGLYARTARADAMRHARTAVRDVGKAAHHAAVAGREAVTGRF